MLSALLLLAAVPVVPAGEVFTCTPASMWDGDGLYGALRVLVCGWRGLLPERWTVAAVQTSHAPMPLLP